LETSLALASSNIRRTCIFQAGGIPRTKKKTEVVAKAQDRPSNWTGKERKGKEEKDNGTQ